MLYCHIRAILPQRHARSGKAKKLSFDRIVMQLHAEVCPRKDSAMHNDRFPDSTTRQAIANTTPQKRD
eukprot:4432506-Amphidinium_carterae.1